MTEDYKKLMDYQSWLILAGCLLLSAFFSGMEIAFVSANKLRLELESKQGKFSSKIISDYFLQNPSRFIGTMLVGNNIMLVIYGIYFSQLLEPYILKLTDNEINILVVQTLISTIVILFAGEFIPKALFRIDPNSILSIFAIPAFLFFFLLYPFVFLTIGLAEGILKSLLRIELPEGKINFGKIDLDNYLREGTESHIQQEKEIEHEIQILKNALDFSEIRVRECMVPRTEIVAIDVESSIEELRNKFIETGLSKILIYKNNIDEVIGYVHSYEMFKKPQHIRAVMLPVLIFPESMFVNDALSEFIKERKSIAVVVDEFGGTSGIVTMEDIMEELFGEIDDEHDVEDLLEKQVSDNEYIFAGRLEVDYINEKYRLKLPISEDYETISGLLTTYHGSIPHKNETIWIEDKYMFKISSASDTKVDKVYLKVMEEE
jgi:CBS domain containing-hemolysin-like protein